MRFFDYISTAASQAGYRDLFDIARRDEERHERQRANDMKYRFEQVFNYRPDLGEPVVDGDKRAWWVQGYLWADVDHQLCVMTKHNKWVGITFPRDLLKYEDLLEGELYDSIE